MKLPARVAEWAACARRGLICMAYWFFDASFDRARGRFRLKRFAEFAAPNAFGVTRVEFEKFCPS